MAAAPLPGRARSEEPQGAEGAVLGVRGGLWTPWGWDILSPGGWVRRGRCPAACAGGAGGRGFALLESCRHKLTAGLPPAPLLAELGSGNPRPRREEELTYDFFPFLLSSRCVGCGLPFAYGLEPGQKPTARSLGPRSPGLGTGAMSRRCLCPGPAAVSPCPQQRPRPGAVGADGAPNTSQESTGCDTRSSTTALPSLPR